jgi:hypothetical protein
MLDQRPVRCWNSASVDFARFEAFALLVLTGNKCRRSLRTADAFANGLAVLDTHNSRIPELVRAGLILINVPASDGMLVG